MTDEEWLEYKKTGIIPFPEVLTVRVYGDKKRAEQYSGDLAQFLGQMKIENVNNYEIFTRYFKLNDNDYVRLFKNYNLIIADIVCPEKKQDASHSDEETIPVLEKGQFYWVPGCKARYGFDEGKELDNEIPIKSTSESDTSNSGMTFAI